MKLLGFISFIYVFYSTRSDAMRSDQHSKEAVKMLSVKVQDGDIDRIQHQLSENITAKDTTSRMKHLMEQLEELQKETSFGWDGVKDKAEERVKEVLQSLKEELADSDAVKNGATCPKNWKFIADGYDYGIGCNLGCKCPSFVDVCATSPRIGKASDLKEPQTRFSVAQLGYCRTGAWVFILAAVLLLLAISAAAFYAYKKRSV